MTEPRGANPGGASDRDEIERLFDRELSAEQRRALIGRLRRDPAALDEVIETRRMVHQLRRPVASPDLTQRVLHDVERQRGFLSARLRRRVRRGRAGVAAAALLALFSLAVAHRLAPDSFRLTKRATPVGDLGRAVVQDSIESRRVLADVVNRLEPVDLIDADHAPSASLGLAEFHVPVEPGNPDGDGSRYLVLTASSSDAEMLALGGPRMLMVDGGADASGSGPMAGLVSGVLSSIDEAPALRGFASVALMTAAYDDSATTVTIRVSPGVVPLSARRGSAAYVGRLDPLRSLDLEASQPDR